MVHEQMSLTDFCCPHSDRPFFGVSCPVFCMCVTVPTVRRPRPASSFLYRQTSIVRNNKYFVGERLLATWVCCWGAGRCQSQHSIADAPCRTPLSKRAVRGVLRGRRGCRSRVVNADAASRRLVLSPAFFSFAWWESLDLPLSLESENIGSHF